MTANRLPEQATTHEGEPPTRVFVADEHPIFLAGLHSCLQREPGIELVGETQDVAQLIEAVSSAGPDIVVTSANFNGMSVVEALLASVPHVRMIVLLEQVETIRARQMLSIGVRGYVFKQSPIQVLTRAIVAVRRGGYFIDQTDSGRYARSLLDEDMSLPRTIRLTNREREVLRLIALGFSVREAADNMGITVKSAETYKARASTKLHIDSRRKIVQYAIVQGWYR